VNERESERKCVSGRVHTRESVRGGSHVTKKAHDESCHAYRVAKIHRIP